MASSYQITCLCGAIQAPIRCSKASEFPFPTSLCHCNPCRQATGALYSALPRLTEAPSSEALAQCTLYASLGPTGLQRYFCSRCGTHVCLLDTQDGEWHCGSGATESLDAKDVADRVRVTGHIFANDPEDGGVMGIRPGLVKLRYSDYGALQATDELPCFDKWKEGPPIPFAPLKALAESSSKLPHPKDHEELIAKCHCGGTDLRIRRANYALDQQGVAGRSIPPVKHKYQAYMCACRSCRLANGVASFQPWASVPLANISIAATGKRVAFGTATTTEGDGNINANEGTLLKYYWSSKNVCWSFCGRCGSLMFYWNESKSEVVDVAVGNLRAEEGSLAQRWLWWKWEEVSFKEEVVDREIYRALIGEIE